MNTWISRFHNTEVKSTLTQSDVDNVGHAYWAGYITSKDSRYRRLRRMEKALCPHNNHGCCCSSFNMIEVG